MILAGICQEALIFASAALLLNIVQCYEASISQQMFVLLCSCIPQQCHGSNVSCRLH